MQMRSSGVRGEGLLVAGFVAAVLVMAPACGTDPDGEDGGSSDGGTVTDGGTSDGGGGVVALSFAEVEATLFSGCTNSQCHGAGNANGIVEYEGGDVYGRVVGAASQEVPSMNLVEPGAPDQSYLYRKLEHTHEQVCVDLGLNVLQCGDAMPRNGTAIPADRLEGLRLWILDGAPDN